MANVLSQLLCIKWGFRVINLLEGLLMKINLVLVQKLPEKQKISPITTHRTEGLYFRSGVNDFPGQCGK